MWSQYYLGSRLIVRQSINQNMHEDGVIKLKSVSNIQFLPSQAEQSHGKMHDNVLQFIVRVYV